MWFLSLRRPTRPLAEAPVTLDDHLAWVRSRHESGEIVISGPTPDRMLSISVIRAGSLAEAEAIAASDPIAAAGFAEAEVIEWEVHQILGMGAFTAESEARLAADRATFHAGTAPAVEQET
jgi:uncharacterized protein YciI